MLPALLSDVKAALLLALWLSLPALGAAALAGLLGAGFASLTRLSDASAHTVPKQLAVGLALWLASGWMGLSLWQYTSELWARLGQP